LNLSEGSDFDGCHDVGVFGCYCLTLQIYETLFNTTK